MFLGHDLLYALRRVRQSPGFAAAAALTLALGVGANTAILGLLDDVLLRPLPLPEPGRLVALYSFDQKAGRYRSTSYPDYKDFQSGADSFRELSAYVRLPLTLRLDGQTERLPGEAVTANYFSMLGLSPVAGRWFRSSDVGVAMAEPVAIISERLWKGAFQRSPKTVGATITLEDRQFTIAGIAPQSYRGTNLNWSAPPQVWILLQSAPLVFPHMKGIDILRHREMRWLLMLGRLKPGLTVAQVQAQLQLLASRMAQAEPATNRDITLRAFPASQAKFWPAYRASVIGSFALLAVGAALVLLLACANVSNLLLERGLGRRREIAIRLSIGASRWRLIRQLLVENLLLVLLSFFAALLVAYGLERVLLHFPNAFGIPLALEFTAETRALAICFSLSIGATLLFGLAPALQTTRPDLLPALKESGNRGSVDGRSLLRNALVMLQVAFSMVLLVGGGLFARSLLKAYSVDLGFESSHLLTAAFDLPTEGYAGARGRQFVQTTLERISGIPGVESATVSSELPLTMFRTTTRVMNGSAPKAGAVMADSDVVGPAYLKMMGIALLAGRDFTGHDDAGSAKVAIVNRTLARRLWGDSSPVGQEIVLDRPHEPAARAEIVGVARDAKYHSVWEQAEPYIYFPVAQSGLPSGHLIVRTVGPPEAFAHEIRRQWSALAPRVPLYDVQTGEEGVNRSLAPQRLAAGMLAAFGVLAILLAAVGLYSLMAYSVMRRTREIGIRVAIGARPEIVVREILARTLRLAGAGILLGLAVSLALMRFVASQVKDVSPYDGATFASAALLLLVVSFAATLLPALRAARSDPLIALKCE